MDKWIAAALKVAGNTHTVDDVKAAIARGDAHLWLGERSVVVTEFYTAPRAKILNLWLAGGDLKELLATLPAVEAWGRVQGCSHVICAGRLAWGRVLAKHGFEPSHTIFEKEL